MKKSKYLWILFSISFLIKIIFIIYYVNHYDKSFIWGHTGADLNHWWRLSEMIKLGLIPRIDIPIEYPSGAVAIYWLPLLLCAIQRQFYLVNGIIMLIFDMINVYYLFKICSLEKKENINWILFLYLFCPTILCLNNARFDIIPATLTVMAYYYYRRERTVIPALLLGLGISIKWAPIFMLLSILLYEFFQLKRFKRTILFGLLAFSVYLLINLPFVLATYIKYGTLKNWLYFYTFQANRPIYFDTMISLIRWFINPDYQPQMGPYIITATLIILISIFHPTKEIIGKYVLYCFAFLVYNRAHSPQFHIWFYPFLLLCIRDGFWPRFSLGTKKIFKIFLGISPISIYTLEILSMMVYPFCTAFIFRVTDHIHPVPLLSFKILVLSMLLRELLLITIGWHLFITDYRRDTQDKFILFKRLLRPMLK